MHTIKIIDLKSIKVITVFLVQEGFICSWQDSTYPDTYSLRFACQPAGSSREKTQFFFFSSMVQPSSPPIKIQKRKSWLSRGRETGCKPRNTRSSLRRRNHESSLSAWAQAKRTVGSFLERVQAPRKGAAIDWHVKIDYVIWAWIFF